MSKELEALKRIVNEISNYKLHGLGDENWLGIQDVLKDIDIIEQALTPPTQEEVCEELGEYYEKTVYYTDFYIDKGFVLQWYKNKKSSRDMKLVLGKKYRLVFYRELPPHLITMIGRFYEKESERE